MQKLMFKGVSAGISAYGKAIRLISKLGLWGYVFIPALISLFLAVMIGYSAWNLSDVIGHQLMAWYPWETGQAIVESIIGFVGIAAIEKGSHTYWLTIGIPLVSEEYAGSSKTQAWHVWFLQEEIVVQVHLVISLQETHLVDVHSVIEIGCSPGVIDTPARAVADICEDAGTSDIINVTEDRLTIKHDAVIV